MQRSLTSLTVGLAAQHLFNREEDKQAQLEDADDIKRRQDEIYALNQKAYQALQKFQLDEKEHHYIILQQLTSIKRHLANLNLVGSSLLIQEQPSLDSKFKIDYFDLTFEQLIMIGSFGKIYRGQWHKSNVAIKLIEGTINKEEYQQFKREVAILTHLHHPQIITFYGACFEEGRCCIVLELAKSNLYNEILKSTFTPLQQKQFALDIAKGLAYLHAQSVLHRDLTSKHILLTEQGVKLTGFGLSKTNYHFIQSAQHLSQTSEWQAPEYLKNKQQYTKAAEIYSYGIILWEIMHGKRPYANIPSFERVNFILQGGRETLASSIPSFYQELITACWNEDSTKRPSFEYIIQQLEQYQPMTIASSNNGEQWYSEGLENEKAGDYRKAYEHYNAALKAGFYKANTNIGLLFLPDSKGKARLEINKQKAYPYLLNGAQAGHLRAMFNLAKMLKDGDGIPQDKAKALEWYQKAATKALETKQTEEYQLVQEKIKTLTAQINSSSSYQGFDFSLRK